MKIELLCTDKNRGPTELSVTIDEAGTCRVMVYPKGRENDPNEYEIMEQENALSFHERHWELFQDSVNELEQTFLALWHLARDRYNHQR